MLQQAFDYIDRNKARFVEELKDFLRFPSVSADGSRAGDVLDCAVWLCEHIKSIGLDCRVVKTAGHPIVLARSQDSVSRRLLVYGHYDVQPEDPLDQWHTPPFEPVVREGFIYGRGSSDDKGQIFAHIKAVESIVKTSGKLPCDVVFLIEGEEESGGTSLGTYVLKNKKDLACDGIVVSDTAMYDENTPAITYGLRGIAAFEVKLKTALADLHSGVFGGAAANPAVTLARMLADCVSADGRVLVPGFYDSVRPLEAWERDNLRKMAVDEEKYARDAGLVKVFGESGPGLRERLWARPTFDVNGIISGYTGEGAKTIIPACASAKISMRLVPDQDPRTIYEMVTGYLRDSCPDCAGLEIGGPSILAEPVVFNVKDPVIEAGRKALECGFGAEPRYVRCGGSIPVVETLHRQLSVPVVLMGFGQDSDGAHSPNEHFRLENFYKAIKSSAALLLF